MENTWKNLEKLGKTWEKPAHQTKKKRTGTGTNRNRYEPEPGFKDLGLNRTEPNRGLPALKTLHRPCSEPRSTIQRLLEPPSINQARRGCEALSIT